MSKSETTDEQNNTQAMTNNGPVAVRNNIPLPTFQHKTDQIDGNESEEDLAKALHSSLQLDFKIYDDRLKSYANFPNDNITKETLAKAGFYYTGIDDIVRCAFCETEGYQWAAGDDPMKDHVSWNSDCPFVKSSTQDDRTVDSCSASVIQVFQNSVPEVESDLQKLGIQKKKGPVIQDKFTYESRLSTFKYWPKYMKQKPYDLADAGFYYTGVGDRTICFHCGNGVKDWEEHDIPWEEHAHWFPFCGYLLLKKGQEFIDEVKRKKDRLAAQSLPEEQENPISEQSSVKDTSDDENTDNEKTLCKICYKNEVGIVFLPCGHMVACIECSEALKTCAVCRTPVQATVRAFLS